MNLYGVEIITVPGMESNRVVLTSPLVRISDVETDEELAARYLKEGKAVVMDISFSTEKKESL